MGTLELEDIEVETDEPEEQSVEASLSDEELAGMIEMNSESSIIEFASEIVMEEDSVLEFKKKCKKRSTSAIRKAR